MIPIPVPDQAKAANPHHKLIQVGPPPGISDADCGTVESLVGEEKQATGHVFKVFCDYWRPNEAELEQLRNGGFIELSQYAPQMVMHSMTVWPPAESSEAS